MFLVAHVENVRINRPFYASNMYRQFIPAEPPKRIKTNNANTSTLTQLPMDMLRIITTFLGGDLLRSLQESRNMMMTCTDFAKRKNLWTAPATWTEQDHVETLLQVMAESPTRWKQWIDTSVVTALSLWTVDDDWMSAVFTNVLTLTKFPHLKAVTLKGFTTLTVLDKDSVWSELQTLNLADCWNITDASVRAVARRCSKLQSLNLAEQKNITDASVSEVARRCSNLQTLNLYCYPSNPNITDTSVMEVARQCSNLQSLNLGGCDKITDASVSEVASGCSNLHTLDLADCDKITDASVSEVARRCSNLQTLNLGGYGSKITDASVSEVAQQCPNLRTLDLGYCKNITDLSVLEVARRCSNLQTLDLEECDKITDLSVLEVARRCSNLQTLDLYNCRKITDACMNALGQSHPELDVFR